MKKMSLGFHPALIDSKLSVNFNIYGFCCDIILINCLSFIAAI